jgi:hypothetical protein
MINFLLAFLEKLSIIPSPNDQTEKLSQVIHKLKTGDLIFSYNATNPVGYGIRYFGNCPYSHVGVIIMIDNKPYLFHATYRMRNLYFDPFTNTEHNSGVILVDFEQAVKHETRPGYFFAYKPVSTPLKDENILKLKEFMVKVKGKCYQLGLTDCMAAVFDKDISPHDPNYFCSELIAQAFSESGILTSEKYQETFLVRDLYDHLADPQCQWNYHYDTTKIIKV